MKSWVNGRPKTNVFRSLVNKIYDRHYIPQWLFTYGNRWEIKSQLADIKIACNTSSLKTSSIQVLSLNPRRIPKFLKAISKFSRGLNVLIQATPPPNEWSPGDVNENLLALCWNSSLKIKLCCWVNIMCHGMQVHWWVHIVIVSSQPVQSKIPVNKCSALVHTTSRVQ